MNFQFVAFPPKPWVIYLYQSSKLLMVFNCSFNYYIYRFLTWKDKKMSQSEPPKISSKTTEDETSF